MYSRLPNPPLSIFVSTTRVAFTTISMMFLAVTLSSWSASAMTVTVISMLTVALPFLIIVMLFMLLTTSCIILSSSILVSVAECIKQLQLRSIMLNAEHQRLIDTIRKTNELVQSGTALSVSSDEE
jgi:hypothetical protein